MCCRVWVRGIDSKGIAAKWSTPGIFVVAAAPVATESVQSTFSRTPTVSWSVVSGAVSHNLYLRNVNTGETENLTGITGTTWTPTQTIGDGNWTWRVQGMGASGHRTFWSETAHFTSAVVHNCWHHRQAMFPLSHCSNGLLYPGPRVTHCLSPEGWIR